MNSDEQKLFVQSFQNYLQYGDDDSKFVVNLDDIFDWMGFDKKGNATRLLTKKFKINEDYIELVLLKEEKCSSQCNNKQNLSHPKVEQLSQRGGHNKITIMMTVNCFKEFCIQANTSKAKVVRSYYT